MLNHPIRIVERLRALITGKAFLEVYSHLIAMITMKQHNSRNPDPAPEQKEGLQETNVL